MEDLMEDLSAAPHVSYETRVFFDHFQDLADARQRDKVMHPLDEILHLALLAEAETFVDAARLGTKKLALLQSFRAFLNGTPSYDHLGGIFASLNAEHFQRRFVV